MARLKRVHINQHVIRANQKNGTKDPVISVMHSKGSLYGHDVSILGPCRVIYRPEKPLSCGARVWLETRAAVEVDGKDIDSALQCN